MPKSRRIYQEEINFEEFEMQPVMLKRELGQPDDKAVRQARLRGLNLEEIGYQEPFMFEVLPDGKFDEPGGNIGEFDYDDPDQVSEEYVDNMYQDDRMSDIHIE